MLPTEEKSTYNRSRTPDSKLGLYNLYLLQCKRIRLDHSLFRGIIHSLTLRPNEKETSFHGVCFKKITENKSILIELQMKLSNKHWDRETWLGFATCLQDKSYLKSQQNPTGSGTMRSKTFLQRQNRSREFLPYLPYGRFWLSPIKLKFQNNCMKT